MTIIHEEPTVVLDDYPEPTLGESLILLGEWLISNPEVQASLNSPTLYMFSKDPEDFKAMNRKLGAIDKSSSSYYLTATKVFGKVKLQHSINHEAICEKKVVGTKTEEVYVPVEDAEYEYRTVTEDIVEWICPETWR